LDIEGTTRLLVVDVDSTPLRASPLVAIIVLVGFVLLEPSEVRFRRLHLAELLLLFQVHALVPLIELGSHFHVSVTRLGVSLQGVPRIGIATATVVEQMRLFLGEGRVLLRLRAFYVSHKVRNPFGLRRNIELGVAPFDLS